MTIIESLKEECTKKVEMWSGDVVAPLQCGMCCGAYQILQWDDIKRDYTEWLIGYNHLDVLLRYFRAKCFEGVLLNCDNILDQGLEFNDLVMNGELHC